VTDSGAPDDSGVHGVFRPDTEWAWVPGPNTPMPLEDQVLSTPVIINLTDDNNACI